MASTIKSTVKVAERKAVENGHDITLNVIDKGTGKVIGMVHETWRKGVRTNIVADVPGKSVDAGTTRARTVANIRKALS